MTPRLEVKLRMRETEARIAAQVERVMSFRAAGRHAEERAAYALLKAMQDSFFALKVRLSAIEFHERLNGQS